MPTKRDGEILTGVDPHASQENEEEDEEDDEGEEFGERLKNAGAGYVRIGNSEILNLPIGSISNHQRPIAFSYRIYATLLTFS
jgi:hypothetical protein